LWHVELQDWEALRIAAVPRILRDYPYDIVTAPWGTTNHWRPWSRQSDSVALSLGRLEQSAIAQLDARQATVCAILLPSAIMLLTQLFAGWRKIVAHLVLTNSACGFLSSPQTT
jgi:hypothetical protein